MRADAAAKAEQAAADAEKREKTRIAAAVCKAQFTDLFCSAARGALPSPSSYSDQINNYLIGKTLVSLGRLLKSNGFGTGGMIYNGREACFPVNGVYAGGPEHTEFVRKIEGLIHQAPLQRPGSEEAKARSRQVYVLTVIDPASASVNELCSGR